MSANRDLRIGRADMLARRKAGVASGPHRTAAVLLGDLETWEGRASKFLVALNPPIQRPAVAGFFLLPIGSETVLNIFHEALARESQ